MKKVFAPINKRKIEEVVARACFNNPNMQEMGIKLAHLKSWPPTDEELVKYVAEVKGYVQVANNMRILMAPEKEIK